MRENNDDREDRLREGEARVKVSSLISAVERYRALAEWRHAKKPTKPN